MAKIPISIKEGKLAEEPKADLIIGIDLGTTNSLVAVAKENNPYIVKKEGSSSLVPSIIHFQEDGTILVGDLAKQNLIQNPERTIYSAKRLMGKSYNDLNKLKQVLAYHIIETNEEELVKVKVDNRFYTPIELSSEILKALKNQVEEVLEREVSKAVITVPAYFNDAQRQATRDAGKLAGLEVLRIVNEPTAASLAYGIGLDQEEDKKIAVYDLGGGTFDVSILHLQSGVFEVISTNGDTFLGGDDFDQKIIQHWLSNSEVTQEALQENKTLAQQWRIAAEDCKKALSSQSNFECQVEGQSLSLTKETFESLIKELVDKTIESCAAALKDGKLTKEDISEVIMVGGSTRTPYVKERVAEFFGKEVNDKINPDEVVALGAAVQADILAGNQKGILLLDITPLSLGIETMGGLMDTIIPRNNKVPAKASRQYTTSVDGQSKLKISVYQGERDLVEHNRKLGEFVLSGIPGMPAGLPKVDISFMLDADGVLRVKAKELRSDTETSLQIKSQYGITEEEMAKMLLDSITHAKEDMQVRGLLEARNEGNAMEKTLVKFIKTNEAFLNEEQIATLENFKSTIIEANKGEDKNLILDTIEKINVFTEPLANEALTRIIRKEISD